MAGTIEGGKKAAQTNKQRWGKDFYKDIGAAGGRKSTGGGFAKDRELAQAAGRIGGRNSRRGPATAPRTRAETIAEAADIAVISDSTAAHGFIHRLLDRK